MSAKALFTGDERGDSITSSKETEGRTIFRTGSGSTVQSQLSQYDIHLLFKLMPRYMVGTPGLVLREGKEDTSFWADTTTSSPTRLMLAISHHACVQPHLLHACSMGTHIKSLVSHPKMCIIAPAHRGGGSEETD